MKIVSACLAGVPCRYDCQAKEKSEIRQWVESGEAVAVCPEEMGGLPTPRPPAEMQADSRIRSHLGVDVTEAYQNGAAKALAVAKTHLVQEAYLKSKSPMCGVGRIYDGSFTGTLVPGDGVFAKALKAEGIKIHEVD